MAGLNDNPHEADVFYRGQAIHVTGLAAVLVGRIARAADRVNQITIGRIVGHIANGKVHLKYRESDETVRLEE
jgi:ABC-type uncharacterized transport system permease subunit